MAEKKPALASLLREHISNQIKNKYDYSTATSRKQDIQNFIELNKDNLEENVTIAKIRSSHDPLMKKMLKDSGEDITKIQRKHNGKNKLKFNSDMNQANIEPKPQKGKNDETPQQTTQQPNLEQPMPTAPIQAYSTEAVSATFSALFLTLKVAVPELEDLTEDEKKALGEMWQPAFNLYLQNEKLAVIGIPILSTLGLFIPKLLAGRRLGKIKKSKQEGLERQKEIDDKNALKEKQIKEEKETRGIAKDETQTKSEVTPKIGEVSDKMVLPKKED